jgi:hypothetical protein
MPSFLFPNGSFFPTGAPVIRSPTTGTTVALPKGTTDVFLTPAGTLAALTILLPPGPLPGTVVSIQSAAAITALTVQNATGGSVVGAPTTLAANTNVYFQWLRNTWTVLANLPAEAVATQADMPPPPPARTSHGNHSTHASKTE